MLRIQCAQTILAMISLHTVRLGYANGNGSPSKVSAMIDSYRPVEVATKSGQKNLIF